MIQQLYVLNSRPQNAPTAVAPTGMGAKPVGEQRIAHLANTQILHMADASGGVSMYSGSRQTHSAGLARCSGCALGGLVLHSSRIEVEATQRKTRKSVVVFCLVIPIALLHFVTGSNYSGPCPAFVSGYLLDILVPFAFYLLLCPQEYSLLRHWTVKAVLVFGAASSVEIAQLFGVPIFGRSFDPVDFFMYALAVMLAVAMDTVVLSRVFGFWTPKAA